MDVSEVREGMFFIKKEYDWIRYVSSIEGYNCHWEMWCGPHGKETGPQYLGSGFCSISHLLSWSKGQIDPNIIEWFNADSELEKLERLYHDRGEELVQTVLDSITDDTLIEELHKRNYAVFKLED